jgi:hypothetical protein
MQPDFNFRLSAGIIKDYPVILPGKSEFAGLAEPRNVPELCSGISCRSDATAFHPGVCRDFIHAQREFH